MHFKNTVLDTITYVLPDEIWSSDAIEEKLEPLYSRLKLPTGRLELMTGIQERRFWSNPTQPSQASTLAGEKALAQSEVDKKDIDLLIHCSVCRDRLEPATAAYVHHALGLPAHTQILDVSNACLGFLNAIIFANSMIEAGKIKNALIVSGENGRPLIESTIESLNSSDLNRNEIKPYFANLTIGSAATAAIISKDDGDSQKPRFISASTLANSAASTLCQGGTSESQGLEMSTDSEQLLEAGITLAHENFKKFLELNSWDKNTPNHFICHQVGSQHQKALYNKLEIDAGKDHSTFPFLGNVGSAALPVTLAHAIEASKIKQSDKVALLGIGSGLSSIMMSMEF